MLKINSHQQIFLQNNTKLLDTFHFQSLVKKQAAHQEKSNLNLNLNFNKIKNETLISYINNKNYRRKTIATNRKK